MEEKKSEPLNPTLKLADTAQELAKRAKQRQQSQSGGSAAQQGDEVKIPRTGWEQPGGM